MLILFFVICFGASIAGAICGIGGGVIIKPLLDSFGVLDVAAISFLSGCTVLSMTTYSVVKGKVKGESFVDKTIGFPLAAGAAAGGFLGKWLFSWIKSAADNQDIVGAIQAICLLLVTVGTLLYTLKKDQIATKQITGKMAAILIGIFLGILSSFLGIGGGPINLVILFYFFSMTTKVVAENSLYIIFFSQITSLVQSVVTGSVPSFAPGILVVMIVGGILGDVCGRALNRKMDDRKVDKLFILLMIVMIAINIYNIFTFLIL